MVDWTEGVLVFIEGLDGGGAGEGGEVGVGDAGVEGAKWPPNFLTR